MNDPAPTPVPDPSPTPAADPAPVSNQDPAPVAARPDWAPEKFWKDGAVDAENLAKSYRALETKLSTVRPGEVPDTADGYELKPEVLPEGLVWSEEAAKQFAAVFHAKGVSKEAAKDIAKTFMELEAQNHAALAAAYEKQVSEGTAALRKEWGAAYESKLGQVKSVVASLGFDPKDAALFANPKVVSFLGKVVGMLSEDSVASMRGAVAPGNSFVNGTEEARAIMRDKSHPDYEAYHAGDRAAIAKVKRLIDG